MKEGFMQEVVRRMLPYLDNEQLARLRAAMEAAWQAGEGDREEDFDMAEAFLAAKRIEGCSEKTLAYYGKTIRAMLCEVGKPAPRITTDDLRQYLTAYQERRGAGKVTIDNIRRILSSFFSWLEDEDYIVKSPIRRIEESHPAHPQSAHGETREGDLYRRGAGTHARPLRQPAGPGAHRSVGLFGDACGRAGRA